MSEKEEGLLRFIRTTRCRRSVLEALEVLAGAYGALVHAGHGTPSRRSCPVCPVLDETLCQLLAGDMGPVARVRAAQLIRAILGAEQPGPDSLGGSDTVWATVTEQVWSSLAAGDGDNEELLHTATLWCRVMDAGFARRRLPPFARSLARAGCARLTVALLGRGDVCAWLPDGATVPLVEHLRRNVRDGPVAVVEFLRNLGSERHAALRRRLAHEGSAVGAVHLALAALQLPDAEPCWPELAATVARLLAGCPEADAARTWDDLGSCAAAAHEDSAMLRAFGALLAVAPAHESARALYRGRFMLDLLEQAESAPAAWDLVLHMVGRVDGLDALAMGAGIVGADEPRCGPFGPDALVRLLRERSHQQEGHERRELAARLLWHLVQTETANTGALVMLLDEFATGPFRDMPHPHSVRAAFWCARAASWLEASGNTPNLLHTPGSRVWADVLVHPSETTLRAALTTLMLPTDPLYAFLIGSRAPWKS